MLTTTDAYNRGLASGKRAAPTLRQRMASTLASWPAEFPATAHLDLAQELLRLDRQRLDAKPSLAKYPETRGWPDLIVAERKGFADGADCGEAETAFHYNAFYFTVYRLYTRYLATPAPAPAPGKGGGAGAIQPQCTAVFIRDSKEGGPLYGRNLDSAYSAGCEIRPPRRGPDGAKRLWAKGVSCWTMADEEPTELFPIDVWHIMPGDCRKLADGVEFVTRYVQYWAAGNGIMVDEDLNCAAYEHSSSRIGWRYTHDGTAAVTACAMVIPEMHAFRESCLRRALELRNYHNDNLPDRKYWSGAEVRYHRLLKLVREAAARGPTLQDLAAIMTDHAVPAPDRICLAGESCHPVIPEGAGEWTLRSRSAVLHGPNRRTLFWNAEGKTPCYTRPPYLILGEGVEMKPEWREGTRTVANPISADDEMEPYLQYEFDYPITYPE